MQNAPTRTTGSGQHRLSRKPDHQSCQKLEKKSGSLVSNTDPHALIHQTIFFHIQMQGELVSSHPSMAHPTQHRKSAPVSASKGLIVNSDNIYNWRILLSSGNTVGV
jgi:hypothetical protein